MRGSRLYLKLKKAVAERIGIEFEVVERTVLSGKDRPLLTVSLSSIHAVTTRKNGRSWLIKFRRKKMLIV